MSDCRHAGTDVPTREINPIDCPFCGGEGVIVWRAETDKSHGECLGCGARTVEYDTGVEAERAWNTRNERTCENMNDKGYSNRLECSACGYGSIVTDCRERHDAKPRYWPNCGAKVVDSCDHS